MAKLAQDNNWQGIVIYGYIRDIEEIETMPIGVVALGAVPRKTEKRGLGEVNLDIQIAGLKVKPGEYLYADGSGVIVADRCLHGGG